VRNGVKILPFLNNFFHLFMSKVESKSNKIRNYSFGF
jgi:hypothetical protein